MCVAIEMMLRVSVHQMMSIHERQVTTQDNVMLQQLHQWMFQEMVYQHIVFYFINCIYYHRHLMCYLRLGLICGNNNYICTPIIITILIYELRLWVYIWKMTESGDFVVVDDGPEPITDIKVLSKKENKHKDFELVG